MFAWTKQMNFTRWVIVLAFVASIGLGFMSYRTRAELTRLEDQTARLPMLTFDIVRMSHELQSLRKIASSRQDLDNLNSFITKTAAKQNVEIGSVDITSNRVDIGPGLADEIFSIRPPKIERRPEYLRTRIANFAFSLEQGTAVRVTKLKITPAGKTPDNEVAPDLWNFELEVRQRKRTGTEAAAG